MSSPSSKSIPRFTPEQYLFLERNADFKSEFDNGIIQAMAGGTRAHNVVAVNLTREISAQFKGRPCEVYMGDMRVWVGPARQYNYPDIVALCGEPRFQDEGLDTLLNPVMIAEVLSRSTERKDRTTKFAAYRRLESLREYVLIDPRRVLVERYTRQGENWVLTVIETLESVLHLESVGCDIPLGEIYARVISAEDVPDDDLEWDDSEDETHR
jgi:Uma2 family endonuclease